MLALLIAFAVYEILKSLYNTQRLLMLSEVPACSTFLPKAL